MLEEMKMMIGSNERIIWEGKPNKKCFIFEAIFNPLLPFAVIWGALDFSIIGFGFKDMISDGGASMALFMIFFFALHLMPVWIYLGGALLSFLRYKNCYYIVTDRAVYVSGGIITRSVNTKPFAEMNSVNLHRGVFDRMFNVGDIMFTSTYYNTNHSNSMSSRVGTNILSISEYTEVYNIVTKLQRDIYSDTMYPNDYRPKENHGYNTEYKGL